MRSLQPAIFLSVCWVLSFASCLEQPAHLSLASGGIGSSTTAQAPHLSSSLRCLRNESKTGFSTYRSADRSMAELVEPYGYPFEEYTVRTHDGYLLALYRIPGSSGSSSKLDSSSKSDSSGRSDSSARSDSSGRSDSSSGSSSSSSSRKEDGSRSRPAVLLQHGLLESSAVWVDNGPKESLAFWLADAGFDVWMGNSRGNMFSRAHVSLQPDEEAFWDFSWDEMAAGDLPALMTYILAATGQPKLCYVGHSQGTTVALAAYSENPALASRVSMAVLLAPVAFLQHLDSPPIKALATLETDAIFTTLGVRELLPGDPSSAALFSGICREQPQRCLDILAMICGDNAENLNATRLPLYLQYTPAGTSVRNMVHWAQGARLTKPTFQKYDYGDWCWGPWLAPKPCNWRVYGRGGAPQYRLHDVRVPLALFSGGKDKMAHPADVAALLQVLPPSSVMLHHHEPQYEHLDFTWGLDAHERIYPAIVDLLNKVVDGGDPAHRDSSAGA